MYINLYSLSKGFVGHYCGLDPVGKSSLEQDSKQKFNTQVLGEQRNSMHARWEKVTLCYKSCFYNSNVSVLDSLTTHISTATSTQLAVNFIYIVQREKLFCSGYISYSDNFFLSLSVHICMSENDTLILMLYKVMESMFLPFDPQT